MSVLKSFFQQVSLTTHSGRVKHENEVEAQRKFASQQCPILEAKRQKAIEYLGDRWLLAKKQNRLETPRSF